MYQMPDVPIIDFHTHFPYWGSMHKSRWLDQFTARFGQHKVDLLRARQRKAAERRWDAWNFPPPETTERSIEEKAELWMQEIRKYGLKKVVFLTGGGNDTLAQALAPYRDHMVGFAHHDPFEPGADRELERAVQELGLKGYKMFTPGFERPVNDEALYPVWETVERLQIPVLIHFGVGAEGGELVPGRWIDPTLLKDVAKAFPTIPFVIPHFGAGFMAETLRLCWACENVYVDTSGSNHWMDWMPYPLTFQDCLRRFYETVGPERIIFGTDSGFLPRGWVVRYFEVLYQACHNINMPREHIRAITHDNAARLLGLPAEPESPTTTEDSSR